VPACSEKALPAYAKVIRTYGAGLSKFLSRLRLRNNNGVTLDNSGKRADSIKVIDEGIGVFEESPASPYPYHLFPQRMVLVANLARAVRDDPQGQVATRLVGGIAPVIERECTTTGAAIRCRSRAASSCSGSDRERGRPASRAGSAAVG
jgi:hypothetical protein